MQIIIIIVLRISNKYLLLRFIINGWKMMNFFLLTPSSFSMFFMISFTIRAYPIIRANTGFLLASNFVHDMMSMSIVCLKMVTYKNENYVSHSATTLLGISCRLSCKEYTSLHKKLPFKDNY